MADRTNVADLNHERQVELAIDLLREQLNRMVSLGWTKAAALHGAQAIVVEAMIATCGASEAAHRQGWRGRARLSRGPAGEGLIVIRPGHPPMGNSSSRGRSGVRSAGFWSVSTPGAPKKGQNMAGAQLARAALQASLLVV